MALQGEDMFIIHHGRVGIEAGGVYSPTAGKERTAAVELGTLATGDFFGEVGVLLPPKLAPRCVKHGSPVEFIVLFNGRSFITVM